MTIKLIEVQLDSQRNMARLRICLTENSFIDGVVEAVERKDVLAFEGLTKLKDRIGGNRLDVDVNLNKACSSIFKGEKLVLPMDLEWPELGK